MTSAILFLIFRRPDTTAQVFEAIRQARPSRLYVAADGPREGREGEAERCAEARRIATDIDWPCEVKTLFRDGNLGCRVGVSTAIDWFFEHEDEGIILEDDCVPSPSFFPYCAELLARYRTEERIMAICGSSFADPGPSYRGSYYFSYYADMWGWATWRRAWRFYDRDLTRWPDFKSRRGLKAVAEGRRWCEDYWTMIFDGSKDERYDSWGYRWIFTVVEQGGMACYPIRNLISNVGFGAHATHTTVGDTCAPLLANRPYENLQWPLSHPSELWRSSEIDSRIEALRLELEKVGRTAQMWRTLRFHLGLRTRLKNALSVVRFTADR